MGLLSRLRGWWDKIFGKHETLQKDFKISEMAVTQEELANQSEFQKIIEGKADWNCKEIPSLGIANSISSKLTSKVLVEFEAEVNAGKSTKPNTDKNGRLNLNNRFKTKVNDRSELLNDSLQNFISINLDDLSIDLNNYGRLLVKTYVKNNKPYAMYYKLGEYLPVKYNEQKQLLSYVMINETLQKQSAIKQFFYYSLVEYCEFDELNKRYTVQYNAYRSYNKDELGTLVELSSVEEWKYLQNNIIFANLEEPFFKEISLPKKLPVWFRGIENIEQADKQYSRVLWEYEGGEFATYIDELYLKTETKDLNGQKVVCKREIPKGKERVIIPMSSGASRLPEDAKKLMDFWTPSLRDESYWRGLNEIKRIIEFDCNLSYGTISDANYQAKTATEVFANKQNTLVIVDKQQQILDSLIKFICRSFNSLCDIYGFAPSGEWELTTSWGDGVKEDWKEVFARRKSLADSGYLDPVYIISEEFAVSQEEAELMKLRHKNISVQELNIYNEKLANGSIDIIKYLMEVEGMTRQEALKEIELMETLDTEPEKIPVSNKNFIDEPIPTA